MIINNILNYNIYMILYIILFVVILFLFKLPEGLTQQEIPIIKANMKKMDTRVTKMDTLLTKIDTRLTKIEKDISEFAGS